MQPDLSSRLEFTTSLLMAASLALAAFGLSLSARLTGLAYAGLALWLLITTRSSKARLLCGFALPLVIVVIGTNPWAVIYFCATFTVVSFQEKGWPNRLASLLTLVFPALLLQGIRFYLDWLGYEPFWMRPAR